MAIQESLNVPVSVVTTFQDALSSVAIGHFNAVVLDEGLVDLNPTHADHFLDRCTDELPIFVKLAITGVPRCVRQVQLAMRRFDREQEIGAASAQHSIDSQVRDALTSILVWSQLALRTPSLPEDAVRHIESIMQAGVTLQTLLGPKLD